MHCPICRAEKGSYDEIEAHLRNDHKVPPDAAALIIKLMQDNQQLFKDNLQLKYEVDQMRKGQGQ